MEVKFVTHTDGKGLYTSHAAEIIITRIYLNWFDNDEPGKLYGELHAVFDPKWNPQERGDIYTDSLWLREFNACLQELGCPRKSVSYSESGMQGDTYVSMDVANKFLTSKIGQQLIQEYKEKKEKYDSHLQ